MEYPQHTLELLLNIKLRIEHRKDTLGQLLLYSNISLFLEVGIKLDMEKLKDLALCLINVCYSELSQLAIYCMNHQVVGKHRQKDFIKHNEKIKKLIDKLHNELEVYSKDKKEDQHEKTLQKALIDYKSELLEDTYRDQINEAIHNPKYNFVYSQKFLTNTGVRDLLARMLCVTLQVNFYDKFKENRFVFTRYVHEILELFFDFEIMQNFGERELYTLIKEIDIKNPNQMYAGTFLGIQKISFKKDKSVDESNQLMQQWKDMDLSFNMMLDFITEQVNRFIKVINTFSDDF